MPLVDVALPPFSRDALPARVRELLRETDRRIESFLQRGATVPGFVPCDLERVYRGLQAVRDDHLASGDAFCEWGSGFGGATLLAASLDFDACGIEINPDLVAEAEALADHFGIGAEFACGTFVPAGEEDLTDVPQEFAWLAAGGRCGHEELRVDPSDFDVIFAYPWPGEEGVIDGLFERVAATNALLLTYHGYEDLRARRKSD